MLSNTLKNERITARVSEDIRNSLAEAAAITGSTLNQFLVQAAIEKAQAIIERERVLRLSYKDAETFFEALENPPEANETLKATIKKYRRLEKK